jgi:DNA-binding transcriptional LysR family regulator
MRFRLAQLEYVVALARHGGFRRAADAIGMSQPALSRSIRQLEESLGVALFDRSRNGVELTDAGRLVVDHALEVLVAGEELEREVDLVRGVSAGRLVVGLGPYPAALSGHEAIARMLEHHPRVQVEARVSGWQAVAQGVLDRSLDLGLAEVSEARRHPDLEATPMITRRGVLVCRPDHPRLDRTHIEHADVLSLPWICTRIPIRVAGGVLTQPDRAGVWDDESRVFIPAVCVDAVFDIGRLTAGSDALGLAVLPMVRHELEAGILRVLPYRPPWLSTNYGFIARRGRTPSPAAEAFMDLVREIEAEVDRVDADLEQRFVPREVVV